MSTLSTISFTVIKSGLELTYKLVRHIFSKIVKRRRRVCVVEMLSVLAPLMINNVIVNYAR